MTRDVSICLPIRTVSLSNQREHWRVRAKRAKEQRGLVLAALLRVLHGRGWSDAERVTVRLTRMSPRGLDSDNLQGALKSVRDGVADALGWDDGDERFTWEYDQVKTRRGICGVRIDLEEGARDE